MSADELESVFLNAMAKGSGADRTATASDVYRVSDTNAITLGLDRGLRAEFFLTRDRTVFGPQGYKAHVVVWKPDHGTEEPANIQDCLSEMDDRAFLRGSCSHMRAAEKFHRDLLHKDPPRDNEKLSVAEHARVKRFTEAVERADLLDLMIERLKDRES